jgi:hypothetical protein
MPIRPIGADFLYGINRWRKDSTGRILFAFKATFRRSECSSRAACYLVCCWPAVSSC